MSDRIAVMHRGRLEQVGTPEDIYLRPSSRFVAGFLGAVNWIGGVGVRPETTRIGRVIPANGARSVAGTIESCVFLGNCLHVTARLAGGDSVIAEVSRHAGEFVRGEAVYLWWNGEDELHLPAE